MNHDRKVTFDCLNCSAHEVCKYFCNEEFDKLINDVNTLVANSGFPLQVDIKCSCRVKNNLVYRN